MGRLPGEPLPFDEERRHDWETGSSQNGNNRKLAAVVNISKVNT